MTLRKFLRSNRHQIDDLIRFTLRQPGLRITDHERRQWILGDESLSKWARVLGVRGV